MRKLRLRNISCLTALGLMSLSAAGMPRSLRPEMQAEPTGSSLETPYLPLLEGAARTIGDAPIAAFGECSHFLRTLHEFSNELFRYLVERKGFRVFMVESAWAANDYLMDFVKSDKPDLEPWMSFYLNAFDSPPTRRTLLYMRDYNKRHPDDPLQIAGMQPEQPWTDYRELNAVLAVAGLKLPERITSLIERAVFGGKTFSHDIDVIVYHGTMSRQKQRTLGSEDQADLARALDEIDKFLGQNSASIARATSKAALEEAKLRVLGLRFYALTVLPWRDFGLLYDNPTKEQVEKSGRDSYTAGDAFRFEIIKTQRETRFKGKKILIWMHSWHAAKRSETIETTIAGQPPKGTISLGTRLFGEFGPKYKIIHSVVAAPDFVYPPGVVTIDNAFYRLFGDRPAYVDILSPSPGQEALPLDVFLAQLSQIDNAYGGGMILQEQFDGIVYFPKSGLTIERKK